MKQPDYRSYNYLSGQDVKKIIHQIKHEKPMLDQDLSTILPFLIPFNKIYQMLFNLKPKRTHLDLENDDTSLNQELLDP